MRGCELSHAWTVGGLDGEMHENKIWRRIAEDSVIDGYGSLDLVGRAWRFAHFGISEGVAGLWKRCLVPVTGIHLHGIVNNFSSGTRRRKLIDLKVAWYTVPNHMWIQTSDATRESEVPSRTVIHCSNPSFMTHVIPIY